MGTWIWTQRVLYPCWEIPLTALSWMRAAAMCIVNFVCTAMYLWRFRGFRRVRRNTNGSIRNKDKCWRSRKRVSPNREIGAGFDAEGYSRFRTFTTRIDCGNWRGEKGWVKKSGTETLIQVRKSGDVYEEYEHGLKFHIVALSIRRRLATTLIAALRDPLLREDAG
ncbi:hypothetical protein VUR80DRAFT_2723 [Thermomyces stellatus]